MFVLFAFSMEYNRNILVWVFLLISLLNFLNFLKEEIVGEIKKHIDGKNKNNP